MKLLALTLPLVFALVFTGCSSNTASTSYESTDPNVPVMTFVVPSGIPPERVLWAAEQAFTKRGWSGVRQDGNEVSGLLLHRGIDASVRVQVDGNDVSIFSDSWNVDKNGNRRSRVVPKGWIANLEKDIQIALGLLAG